MGEHLLLANNKLEHLVKERNPFNLDIKVIDSEFQKTIIMQNQFQETFAAVCKSTFNNHMVIEIRFYKHLKKKIPIKIPKREFPTLGEYFLIIYHAYLEYAKSKGLDGVIFIWKEGELDDRLGVYFGLIVEENRIEEAIKNSLAKSMHSNIITYHLSEELKKKVIQVFEFNQTFEVVIKKNPLLHFPYEHETIFSLLTGSIHVSYLGESLELSLNEETETMIVTQSSINEIYTIDNEPEGLNNFLQSLKEKLKLKTLIEKPKDCYWRFISELQNLSDRNSLSELYTFRVDDKNISAIFELLDEEFGGWENAELLSLRLHELFVSGKYKNHEYSSAINSSKNAYVYVNEFKIEDKFLYFIFTRYDINSTKDLLNLIISEVKNPIELKSYIFDLMERAY